MKRNIVFYKEFNEVINKLPQDDKTKIKSAIKIYLETYQKPKLDGYLDAFFEYVKPANICFSQVLRRKHQALKLLERASNCPSYRGKICKRILIENNVPKFCFYCGSESRLCIDHKIPKCNGGRDIIENLVYACASCNCRKKTKDFKEYRKWLETKSPIVFF